MINIKAEKNKETDGMNVSVECDYTHAHKLSDVLQELAAGVGSFLYSLSKQVDQPFEEIFDAGLASIEFIKDGIAKNAESCRRECDEDESTNDK